MSGRQEAYRIALHTLTRQRKFLFAMLLSMLPAMAAWLRMIGDHDEFLYGDSWSPYLSSMAASILLAVSLPLMCILLAGGMLADEAEDRTLSYLLVRPLPRRTLYLSRTLAVVTVALPLAVLQALGLWLARMYAFIRFADADHELVLRDIYQERLGVVQTTGATGYMWTMLPVLIAVSVLACLFYIAVFGLLSMVSTRYHFFLNLAYLGVWEGLIGHLPSLAQVLTATHHLASLLDAADHVERVLGSVLPTHWAVSAFVLIAATTAVMLVAVTVVRRRDFHVTSAAT